MDDKKPYAMAVFIQLVFAGMYILNKAAFNEGMSTFVYIFYRQLAASILFVPLAIFFERKTAPPLPLSVLIKLFVLALVGVTLFLNMYSLGLDYTSPMISSAALNSIPVITFFWALLLRMETVNLKSPSGIAKVIGVALCFSGVMTLCFYVGPHLNFTNHHPLLNHNKTRLPTHRTTPKAKWIIGTVLVIAANLVFSLWLVLQGMLLKEYPSKLLLNTYQSIFSTVQSFFVALAFQRDISRWKLSFNVGLLAIVYSGFFITGFTFYLQTWVIEKKGPVFLSMFWPLALLFTIFASFFILGNMIHLGSLIGGMIMVGGLYCFLWGKNKEIVVINQPTIEDGNGCHNHDHGNEERKTAPFDFAPPSLNEI